MRTTLVLAAFACIVGVSPGTAHALSCGTNVVRGIEQGQENVPTDTLLWSHSTGQTRLLGPSGEVVPTAERALVVGGKEEHWTVRVFVPGSVLEPNARYVIEVDSGSDFPISRTEFVTGDGPAGAPPAQPTLVSSEQHVGTYWVGQTPARWSNLQFKDIRAERLFVIGVPSASESDALGPFTSIEDLLIDGPPAAEAVAEAPPVLWISDNDDLGVGLTDCALWPDGAPDALPGRFGTFDLAGNFSGWVDVPIELPSAAEAQAAADERAERSAEAEAERQRLYAETRAKIDGPGSSCAMQPTQTHGPSASTILAALALVLMTAARRARCNDTPTARG